MIDFDRQKFINWAKEYADYALLEEDAKRTFSGWDLNDPNNVFDHLQQVLDFGKRIVSVIERFSQDVAYLSGKDKLELAVQFTDELVKLPFFFEWIDQIVIKHIYSTIVLEYNKTWGHKWLEAKDGPK